MLGHGAVKQRRDIVCVAAHVRVGANMQTMICAPPVAIPQQVKRAPRNPVNVGFRIFGLFSLNRTIRLTGALSRQQGLGLRATRRAVAFAGVRFLGSELSVLEALVRRCGGDGHRKPDSARTLFHDARLVSK